MDFEEDVKIAPEELKKTKSERFVLAGDVGGTNTSMAVFTVDNPLKHLFTLKYSSKELDSFTVPVNSTLEYAKNNYGIEISDACFGVAGPLYDNRQRSVLTNLKWDIDIRRLKSETLLKNMILINDFEAIGFGIEAIPKDFIEELPHSRGGMPKPHEKETKAVIGAGTGLGECMLPFNASKKGYTPIASEGGHCDISARNKAQMELVQFLIDHDLCGKSDYPGWEEVLSGRGIVSIFKFLTTTKRFKASEQLITRLEQSDDKAAAISELAKQGEPCCEKTMEVFFELYGQEAALLSLKAKALGGLYIAGGIASKNRSLLERGHFMRAFDSTKAPSHPLHGLIVKIPVFLITNYDVSLYGAANAAANYTDIF